MKTVARWPFMTPPLPVGHVFTYVGSVDNNSTFKTQVGDVEYVVTLVPVEVVMRRIKSDLCEDEGCPHHGMPHVHVKD